MQIAAPPGKVPIPKLTPIKPKSGSSPVPVKQKVQIVKATDGKIQVRGLLPDQQLVQMSDGRLQIFSNKPVTSEDLTAASQCTVDVATNSAAPAEISPLETLTRDGGLLAAQVPGDPEGDPQSVSNISLANSIKTTANELKRKYDSIETKIQEGNSSIKTTANELKRKYDSIETKIQEGNSNVEKRIARLESKLENSSESIKSKIEAQSIKSKNGNVLKPKCPICFEEMSTKIAQCISGHLLCWPCKEKMGDKNCAFCDQPVNGRAFGMEAYLRTIFG